MTARLECTFVAKYDYWKVLPFGFGLTKKRLVFPTRDTQFFSTVKWTRSGLRPCRLCRLLHSSCPGFNSVLQVTHCIPGHTRSWSWSSMLAKYLLRGKYFSPKGLRLHIKPSERGFIVYFRIGFGETWLLQTRNRYLTTSASGRKDAML